MAVKSTLDRSITTGDASPFIRSVSSEKSTTFESQKHFKETSSSNPPPPLNTDRVRSIVTPKPNQLTESKSTTSLEDVFKEMAMQPYQNILDQKAQRKKKQSFYEKLKKTLKKEFFQIVCNRINQQFKIVRETELFCFIDDRSEYSLNIFSSKPDDLEIRTQRDQKYSKLNYSLRNLAGNVGYKLLVCYIEGMATADLRDKNTELYKSYPKKIDGFLTTLDPISHSYQLLDDVLREMGFEKGNLNKLSYFENKIKRALLEIEFQKHCRYNNKFFLKGIRGAVCQVDSGNRLDDYSLKVHLSEGASQRAKKFKDDNATSFVGVSKSFHKLVKIYMKNLIAIYRKGATYKEFLEAMLAIEDVNGKGLERSKSPYRDLKNLYEEQRADHIKTMKNLVELIQNYEPTAKELYEIQQQVEEAKRAATELIEEERLEKLKSEKKQKKKKLSSNKHRFQKPRLKETPDNLEAPMQFTPLSVPILITRQSSFPLHTRLDPWKAKNPETFKTVKSYKKGQVVYPYQTMTNPQLIVQGRNHCPYVFPGLLSDPTLRKQYCKLLPKIYFSDDTFIVNCTQVFVKNGKIIFKDGPTTIGIEKNNTIYHCMFKEKRDGTPDNQERKKEYKRLLKKAKKETKTWTIIGGSIEIENKNGVRTYCFDHSKHLLIIYPRPDNHRC